MSMSMDVMEELLCFLMSVRAQRPCTLSAPPPLINRRFTVCLREESRLPFFGDHAAVVMCRVWLCSWLPKRAFLWKLMTLLHSQQGSVAIYLFR